MPETAVETKTAPAPVLIAKGPTPKLHGGRLRVAEAVRAHYVADIPSGTPISTILVPSYWAHVATQLKPQDLIEAFWEDGSQEADLRVMFVGRAEVKVRVKSHTTYEEITDAEVQGDDYEVKWRGPGAKFAVVRRDTGVVIRDKLFPKSEAIAYLRENLLRMRQ